MIIDYPFNKNHVMLADNNTPYMWKGNLVIKFFDALVLCYIRYVFTNKWHLVKKNHNLGEDGQQIKNLFLKQIWKEFSGQ